MAAEADAGPFALADGGAAPDAGPCGTIALLDDDFAPPTLRPQWSATFGGGFGATELTDGGLHLPGAGFASGAPAVRTVAAYDLQDGTLDVDVRRLPSVGATSESILRVDARDVAVDLFATAGTLAVRRIVDGGTAAIGASIPAVAPATWRVEARDGGWSFGALVDGGFAALATLPAPVDPRARVELALHSTVDAGPAGTFTVASVRGEGAGSAWCPGDGLDESFDGVALSSTWVAGRAYQCTSTVADGAWTATCPTTSGATSIETWTAYDFRDHAIDVELEWPFQAGVTLQLRSTTTSHTLDVQVGDGFFGADSLSVAITDGDATVVKAGRDIAPASERVVVRFDVDHDGLVTVVLLDADGAHLVAGGVGVEVGVEAALLRAYTTTSYTGDDGPIVIRMQGVATAYSP